jgi:hypothetical protein
MNAWGGLRQKASLPTMSMVAIGLAVLLGAGTVSASASPDTSLPVVGTVAHIVKSALSTPLGSILSSPPPQKPATPPKPNTSASDPNKQQAGSNTTTSGSNTSASGSNTANTSSNSNANTQNGAQSPAATLKLASLQCNAGQSSYTIDVSNALLSFQTPTTVNGTLSWEWDTRVDSGASAGQVTAGTISSQPINANTSSVTLTGSSTSQQSQWLYTATSNNTNDYSFRLHVTGPVDVTSDWVNVPQSPTGTCPPQKQ